MIDDISKIIKSINEKIDTINSHISLKDLYRSIEECDGELNNPSIWENPLKAKSISKSRNDANDKINFINRIIKESQNLNDSFSLAEDPSFAEIIKTDSIKLLKEIEEFELSIFLKQPEDKMNAFISIFAGAGGNESEDWASILARMYVKWADKNKFKISTESFQDTPSGLNYVTYKIEGHNAFGLLKNETGVHRLVRNSPFDADFARHTSFAAVEVTPDIDDSIQISINEKDCEIQAIRASGAGGQNVNKVSSCIRLKHIPTGIQIVSRSERDQFANKKAAFERLKAKLFAIELDKRNKKIEELNSNKSDASFGHQIRSYILSPYKLVNDHRSNLKIQDADSVLDGNLNQIIKSNLIKNA